MNQYEVAEILREMSILIELSDPLPQKGLAYRRAARTVEAIRDLSVYVKKQRLETLPGIGRAIAAMISALVFEGRLCYYEELKKKIPATLFELTTIPGLNPRKVRLLYEKMHIQTMEELQQAIAANRLQELKIMRPFLIRKLQTRIEAIQTHGHLLLYPKAFALAQGIKETLKKRELVKKIAITGSLRRKCELISQLNFVALSDCPKACLEAFAGYPAVQAIQSHNDASIQVLLKWGIEAHLKLTSKKHYSLAILVDTGSQKHVAALLREAKKQEMTFSELEEGRSEIFFYSSLGMDYIPPELREDEGEIEAAKQRTLPHLIEATDLRGVFHCHTTDSDGKHTLEQMVEGARKLGWEYIGISDHSKSSYQARGMSEERLFAQIERIRDLNKNYSKFQILAGLECDILKDGQLDFSEEVLKCLDFVIISVHRFFNMEKIAMTKRLIKAIENPYTTMVGHLTGRLLYSRGPYELNMDQILDACIANGKVIELNSAPVRLDMDWRYWVQAREKGLLCSINPDAHSVEDLLNFQYGINIARKGWLEKKDVINAMSLKKIRSFLNKDNRYTT